MLETPPHWARRRAGALGIALAVSFTLLAGALWGWSATGAISAGMQAIPVAQALSYCAAAVAGGVSLALAWLCLLGGAHLLRGPSPRPGVRRAEHAALITPRVAAILLALTVGSPAAAAHSVHDGDGGGTAASTHAAEPVLPVPALPPDEPNAPSTMVPDWRPTRSDLPLPAADQPARSALDTRAPRECVRTGVTVLRGDSLWSIAAEELGPDASEAAIAGRWPAWYAANRLTIGPNPDVILPGHILTHPDDVTPGPTIGDRP